MKQRLGQAARPYGETLLRPERLFTQGLGMNPSRYALKQWPAIQVRTQEEFRACNGRFIVADIQKEGE